VSGSGSSWGRPPDRVPMATRSRSTWGGRIVHYCSPLSITPSKVGATPSSPQYQRWPPFLLGRRGVAPTLGILNPNANHAGRDNSGRALFRIESRSHVPTVPAHGDRVRFRDEISVNACGRHFALRTSAPTSCLSTRNPFPGRQDDW